MSGTDLQPRLNARVNEQALALAREWRRLGRAATLVALLTSPVLFVALHQRLEWTVVESLLGTIGGIAAYRKRALDAADRAFPQATTKPS